MENKDLTTAQVAQILGIHRNTVSKLVKDGKLNPYRITEGTGRMRFKLDDIEKFRDKEDIAQLQPNAIIKNHSIMVDNNETPRMFNDILSDSYERSFFEKVLECANINDIFGKFMKNASISDYSEALEGKSNIWIGETLTNIANAINKKGRSDKVLYQLAGKNLAIGIGSIDLGGYHKPQITTLIYHTPKGDIVISGTIQQFLVLDKGLLLMKRDYAENFFINFKEVTVDEYTKMIMTDTYDSFIKEFMMSVFNSELADEDEDEAETEDKE